MMQISSRMEQYLAGMQQSLEEAMEVAKNARTMGIDPRTEVEIPVADDLADRVEALLSINTRCPGRRWP